ncbi:MAG: hypothetical protein ABI831_13330 [Betaproteobacteria bacterium]
MPLVTRFAAFALCCAAMVPAVVQAAVVEFFNPDLNNYFITADPVEQAFVDTGAVGRWQRTGNVFGAGGPTPVCRFGGNSNINPATGTFYGPNSHFYTADANECAGLKAIFTPTAPSWKFESNDFLTTPAVNGACPAPLIPVYRAYNNGFAKGIASNHRITSNRDAYLQTIAAGSIGEGVVMCAPAPFDVRGEIRGCAGEPGCDTPSAMLGSGLTLVAIAVEIGNTSNQPVTVTIPSGFVFVSTTDQFQDGLLLDTLSIQVPAGGTTRVVLSLYCLQGLRDAATTSATYLANGVTTNAGLLAIVNLPCPRPVVNVTNTAYVVQQALWEVTDGRGPLSAAQLALLRNVFALEESDPGSRKAMTDFLDTLSLGPYFLQFP